MLKARHASISMEIKNLPTDNDFDHDTSYYANKVMTTLLRAKFPKSHVIVQSFWPANLQVARKRWPGVPTSYLTLKNRNGGAIAIAKAQGHVALAGVPDRQGVRHRAPTPGPQGRALHARQEGRRPKAAKKAGVDALITDDPFMALKALGRRIPR